MGVCVCVCACVLCLVLVALFVFQVLTTNLFLLFLFLHDCVCVCVTQIPEKLLCIIGGFHTVDFFLYMFKLPRFCCFKQLNSQGVVPCMYLQNGPWSNGGRNEVNPCHPAENIDT